VKTTNIQPDNSASPWWQVFIDAIDKLPFSQQASRLASLAVMLVGRGERQAAAIVALRAWRQTREVGDSEDDEMVRRALSAVTPGYHSQISTDVERIAAWEAALADVVQPGMLALEIGAGSGILAMLAARAGCDVVSCEKDPVLAAIAEEIVRQNGLVGRIRIVGKSSDDLRLPGDMPRPADLLLLDLFSNTLFDFKPFEIIRTAKRLLQPGAVAVPMRVSLEGALANFRRWHRMVPGRVAGFDLGRLIDLASMQHSLDGDDLDLSLRSAAEPMVSAALPDDLPAQSGVSERILVSSGGPVNGIALWLRLELAGGHVLEARPALALRGFYARPSFFAFRETLDTLPGQSCSIRLRWEGKLLGVSLTERPR
jgi:type III protein arginine methyltransferase